MVECVSREKLKCIFLTKETRDEFLKEVEPRLFEGNDCISIKTDNDRELVVLHLGLYTSYYYYNHWYVYEYHDYELPSWTRYTEEDFKKYYSLVDGDKMW